MKPLPLFLSGSLLGVCITAGIFYMRGPVFQQLLSQRAGNDDRNVAAQLRSKETAMGRAAAPVTLIEYSDFQCPYCAIFHTEIFPRIKARYIDSGQLRFIQRDLPLPSHPKAMTAANAAACAGDQGRYWDLSGLMFTRASCLDCQGILELSKAILLDRGRFEDCVASRLHQPEIDRDIASARELNIKGTPSFVVGRTTRAGVEGVAVFGALPFEEFAAQIDHFISTAAGARR